MTKNTLLFILVVFSWPASVFGQDTLFDQNRVSSVYISISPDSLEYIMTEVLSEHYCMARFVYDYGKGRDTVENAGFRLRGNTSRYAKKKSFKISFNTYAPGRRYLGVKKINLNGQHNDPSMVREKLFYDIWNKAGLPPRRTSFVRLYINDAYYGLYSNLEELDKDWLDRAYGENAGNLYKCTWPASLAFIGNDQQAYKNIPSSTVTGGRAYDLQTNESLDDYSDLVGLITVLNQPVDSTFAGQISQVLDVENFLRAYALDVATGNWDGYAYNKNNYFLYKRQDGRFSFIAYDADNTFGVDWFGIDWTTRNCLHWQHETDLRPLVTKLLEVHSYETVFRQYLDTVVRRYTEPDSVYPHIDHLQSLIQAAAIQDNFRTLDYGYDVSDFLNAFTLRVDDHTPYGIKPFLYKRNRSILDQLDPAIVVTDEMPGFRVYPNPAYDKVFLNGIDPVATRVSLFDMQGREVQTTFLSGNPYLEVGGLPRGLYMLKASSGTKASASKLLLR